MSNHSEPLPWRRGLAWLLLLGPFFFLSYGFANQWTAAHGQAGSVVFAWECHLSFLAWTIVPYWSIDLFYGLSFLLCRTRRAVDVHGRRLLGAQLICVMGFLLFPLRFTFGKPDNSGLFGTLFDALAGFDLPYNQAPSLHIALLVILWPRYAEASRGIWRIAVHTWALLIGISVLTTYQHHFLDVPTGALFGLLCLWLWPDHAPSLWRQWRMSDSPARRRIACCYLLGALGCVGLASFGGVMLWLIWPAVSLFMMALIYFGLGAAGFQKHEGRLSVATAWLLAPYRLGAWINSRCWTRHDPAPVEIADGVWLGRMPGRGETHARIVDLSAEFFAPCGESVISVPMLDLVSSSTESLREAAHAIGTLQAQGPVLVCCALGYSRSATAIAAWLLQSGRAADLDAAIHLIASRRPQIVLADDHGRALRGLAHVG